MTISIVINNFNYARFLSDAIDSALGQRGVEAEVIVVDDGSSDDSRSVIARYAGRVTPVLKANGGQASALNAGFRVSRGDYVIFLDADDMLLPDTAARVAALTKARPGLAKVHYRLAVVDHAGRPRGETVPAANVDLPDGDLRERLVRNPHDLAFPPTSGNAFAAAALRRILPIPEAEYRTLADVFLLTLAPLMGDVGRLEGVGGCYRVHDRNHHYAATLDLNRLRTTIRVAETTRHHLRRHAKAVGVHHPSRDGRGSVTDAAQRLLSRRLAPEDHPLAGDRVAGIALAGVRAALGRDDLPIRHRLAYVGWFSAVAVLPRPFVRRLGVRLLRAWRVGRIGDARG